MCRKHFLIILLLLQIKTLHAGVSESVETVTVRPGVTQTWLQLKPDVPVATVILFAGYGGYLGITSEGIQQPSENFLVRTRGQFAGHGFLTAVIDVPSDFSGVDGILGWRASKTHAEDIKIIISQLRKTADVPVWVVGTSRGTISAANVAARLQQGGPDGLVLTASVTEAGGNNSGYVGDVDLEKITVPTLIAHHEEDDCVVTPFYGAERLLKQLPNVKQKKLIAFNGGKQPESGACEALSEHGFIGLENQVVDAIADWIKQKK